MERVFNGVKPVPNYRLWIYSVNGLIMSFQLLVTYLSYGILWNPLWDLVPLEPSSPIVIVYGIIFIVQGFTCVCGVIGVFISSRDVIRVYWLLMIPLLFIDILTFGLSSYELAKIHLSYTQPSSLAFQSSLCPIWNEFARQFDCIPQCQVENSERSCTFELLRWMHNQFDVIGILLYFVLLPLKLIVILALREDIQELFVEIVYNNNDSLYRHWALGDEDDMCDRDLREEETTTTGEIGTKVFGA